MSSTFLLSGTRKNPAHCSKALGPSLGTFKSCFRVVKVRSDILDMKDLKPGMELTGTVRNVIDFGAFVDIGVHQDGLVHISQINWGYFYATSGGIP